MNKTVNENFWWFIHNVFAHPLSEIFYWCYLGKLGDWIHDVTIPEHEKGTGRG